MQKILLIAVMIATCLVNGCTSTSTSHKTSTSPTTVKENSFTQYTTDSFITSKVKSKFLADLNLKSYNISVSTNKGVVTLTGTVPTYAMKKLAITTVQNTEGVKAVNITNFRVAH